MLNVSQPNQRSGSWRLAFLLLLGGCVVPPASERPAARTAQVTLVNQTDYTWQISLVGSAAPAAARVEAKRTVTLDVPGGSYQIEQLILNQTERRTLPRSFPAVLVAGKRYVWPLLTLQSDTTAAVVNDDTRTTVP